MRCPHVVFTARGNALSLLQALLLLLVIVLLRQLRIQRLVTDTASTWPRVPSFSPSLRSAGANRQPLAPPVILPCMAATRGCTEWAGPCPLKEALGSVVACRRGQGLLVLHPRWAAGCTGIHTPDISVMPAGCMLSQGCPRVAFECKWWAVSTYSGSFGLATTGTVIMTTERSCGVPHLVWRAGGRSGRSREARPGHTAAAGEEGGDERALTSAKRPLSAIACTYNRLTLPPLMAMCSRRWDSGVLSC